MYVAGELPAFWYLHSFKMTHSSVQTPDPRCWGPAVTCWHWASLTLHPPSPCTDVTPAGGPEKLWARLGGRWLLGRAKTQPYTSQICTGARTRARVRSELCCLLVTTLNTRCSPLELQCVTAWGGLAAKLNTSSATFCPGNGTRLCLCKEKTSHCFSAAYQIYELLKTQQYFKNPHQW